MSSSIPHLPSRKKKKKKKKKLYIFFPLTIMSNVCLMSALLPPPRSLPLLHPDLHFRFRIPMLLLAVYIFLFPRIHHSKFQMAWNWSTFNIYKVFFFLSFFQSFFFFFCLNCYPRFRSFFFFSIFSFLCKDHVCKIGRFSDSCKIKKKKKKKFKKKFVA